MYALSAPSTAALSEGTAVECTPAPRASRPKPVEPPASPCRFCGAPLDVTFVNLGTSPLCQHHVRPHQYNHAEAFYPLHARVCRACFLVQLDKFVTSEQIFQDDYAYFSSYSASWLRHASRYTDMATARFELDADSQVVEVASNDGYLLQYFVAKGIPVLGIEPARNVAEVARGKGIDTLGRFFGCETAQYVAATTGQADLLLGNNVLAHVPDINDFVAGMKLLLKPEGVITMEFPHLLRLMEGNQFDTIYHEHFSYLSFYTVELIFAHHGLTLFDVEELSTHGGSLRIFARHTGAAGWPVSERVMELRAREVQDGITSLASYADFEEKAKETKRKLLEFLIDAKRRGKTVVGYGAPGKGNTLLNYCGIHTDFLDYTVDVSPHKQGNFLPGTRIPICHPDLIFETRPDYVLILPWNLREEIMEQMAGIRKWGGRFVVPIPEVLIYA
ncbi:class I SAM-dependent methyltransferase [Hymenobacter psychrotolerans]|uniref:Methyltransferase domain-containing protein n=1 Tax=Hymenobacter psychrotolerans DSM 18569 TaxID=1121959 RepID=A0A1M6W406_9BACT|nr:class I SAM-dependent methyltransferase [Hymenobacter psychrotolerans]SHK88514.1 Methyltransferase domain-containing protein [Hymenobacter psychrotolerans DSM 18569]